MAAAERRFSDPPPSRIYLDTDIPINYLISSQPHHERCTTFLDRLARDGLRFTSFYVSQPVCTASRASLLTGCYANRVSLTGALNHTRAMSASTRGRRC